MKKIIKKSIVFLLIFLAYLTLKRYKPKVIGITGSVGKTSTKDAIFTALSSCVHARKNQKSFNSDIGVPLTILGIPNAWDNPIKWIKYLSLALWGLIYNPKYPEWLVLEVGVDRPGDMKRTASWIKFDVVAVTAFPLVAPHVEFFTSPEALLIEESSLVNYLKPNGIAILNADDERALNIKNKIKNVSFTFGFNKGVDVLASNFQMVYKIENGLEKPEGIAFKVEMEGNTIPIVLKNILGKQLVYPILSALTIIKALNLPILKATEAIQKHNNPPGRMSLLRGKNDSLIIDDGYNASPSAVEKAINTLFEIKGNFKKVAILGDMRELGKYAVVEHKKIGELVAQKGIDILITCGMLGEYIAESALASGMKTDQVFIYKNSLEACEPAKEFLNPNTIYLIKGSQGIRMEKITKELLHESLDSKECLVRQDKDWEVR
jgi:UDP-N-acetylmuramoyl-tripeptide--D-alanyl-D-alanine ligase